MNKNVFLKLFLSFLSTSMLSVIILTLFVSIYLKQKNLDYITNNTQLLLKNVVTRMTNIFEATKNSAYIIYNNKDTQALIFSDMENEDEIYSILSVNRLIDNTIILNTYINSIYICKNNAFILKKQRDPTLNETNYEMHKIAKNNHVLVPIPRRLITKNGKTYDFCTFVYYDSTSIDKGIYIMINIDLNKICQDIFIEYNANIQEILLINNDGTILLHSNNKKLLTNISNEAYVDWILKSKLSYNSFYYSKDKKYVINYFSYFNHAYYFISIIKLNIIEQYIGANLKVLLISIVLLLIIILVSIVISIRYYIPINSIFNNIQDVFHNKDQKKDIENSQSMPRIATKIVEKLNNIELDKEKSYYVLRNNFIKNILITPSLLSMEELRQNLLYYKIINEKSSFINLIILRVDGYNKSIDEIRHESTQEEINVCLKAIGETFYGTLKNEAYCSYVEMEPDQIILFLSMPNNDVVLETKKLYFLIEKAKRIVSDIQKINITIGVSQLFNDYTQIRENYLQVLEITNYRLIYGKNLIFDQTVLPAINNSCQSSFNYDVKLILNSVKNKNKKAYMYELDEFISAVKSLKYENILELLSNLAILILKIPLEIGFETNVMNTYYYAFAYNQIKDLCDINDLKNWFYALFDKTAGILEDSLKLDTYNIVIKALKYLDENFSKPSLSASILAEILSISPHYFSKIFNEYTFSSFPEYLNNLRLAKAKELLLDNKKADVEEVCKAVGYNNRTYFSTLFKKKFGVSPSQIRLINANYKNHT